jgi:hypothetical protein
MIHCVSAGITIPNFSLVSDGRGKRRVFGSGQSLSNYNASGISLSEEVQKPGVMPKEGPNSPQKNEMQGLNDLIDAIVPLVREYIDFKKTEFKAREERIVAIGKHNRHLTYSLLGFLLGIVALMTILTFLDKVSPDALLFLAGTIVGYMIVWVQGLIFAPTEEASDGD